MDIGTDVRIGVVGYGSWATALVGLLTGKGIPVRWHVSNPDVLECLREEGRNPKYISDLEFDTQLLELSDDLNEVVSGSDLILLATLSAYLKKFLEPLSVPLHDKFIVSAIKGIIQGEYTTVLEFIRDCYGVPEDQLFLISGPTHAEDVAMKHPSFMTAAGFNAENTAKVAEIFTTKQMKVNTSSDVFGIEYASILKNIYAIASGLATGLGLGDNFLAALISKCASELKDFLDACYPCERNITDKAYLGDMLVTCYSPFSRNRRFGQLIGRGFSVKSAINEMTMTAEGYFGADCIHRINETKGVDLPVSDMVYRILYEKSRPGRELSTLGKQL